MVLIFHEALIYDTNICYNDIQFYKNQSINQKKTKKQEMSQSRDECPQRNWSSIRHIRGKLAVIKEICSRHQQPRNEARNQSQRKSDPKWYAPLSHPKRNQHTKFGIPTSNIEICSRHDYSRN